MVLTTGEDLTFSIFLIFRFFVFSVFFFHPQILNGQKRHFGIGDWGEEKRSGLLGGTHVRHSGFPEA